MLESAAAATREELPQPAPLPPPTPTKHRRTRSGCLCCRLRKKKCDGQRPTCVACERNSLICSWAATPSTRGLRLPTAAAASPGSDGTATTGDDDTSATTSTSTATSTSTSTAGYRPPPLPPHPDHTPRPGLTPGLLAHSLVKPEHAFVYHNYVARTANTVSTLQNEANPFIRLLVPMAAADGVILDSMLALSAVHLWKSPQPTAGAEQLMSTYETLAIRGLKYGLTKALASNQVDTSLIIGSLLLSLVEAMKGESNYQTTLHLRGCSTLLRQWVATQQAAAEPQLRAFIVELYLYLAISMGIPLGGSGAGSHVYIVQDAGLMFPYVLAARTTPGTPGPLLGCAHELFALIPQIHALAEAAAAADDAEQEQGAASAHLLHTYQTLVDQLFAWKPPRDAHRDLVRAAHVYQQALLVFLLQSLQGCLDVDGGGGGAVDTAAIVDQAAAAAMAALHGLALDAPISTTLTWPLAVLGAASRGPGHQAAVRARLQHLYQTLHWAVFDQVLCVLEALWQDPTQPAGMAGFEVVMKRLNMHVLIS